MRTAVRIDSQWAEWRDEYGRQRVMREMFDAGEPRLQIHMPSYPEPGWVPMDGCFLLAADCGNTEGS